MLTQRPLKPFGLSDHPTRYAVSPTPSQPRLALTDTRTGGHRDAVRALDRPPAPAAAPGPPVRAPNSPGRAVGCQCSAHGSRYRFTLPPTHSRPSLTATTPSWRSGESTSNIQAVAVIFDIYHLPIPYEAVPKYLGVTSPDERNANGHMGWQDTQGDLSLNTFQTRYGSVSDLSHNTQRHQPAEAQARTVPSPDSRLSAQDLGSWFLRLLRARC